MTKTLLIRLLSLLLITWGSGALAQEKADSPNAAAHSWQLLNADVTVKEENGQRATHLKPKGDVKTGSNIGLALLDGVEFGEGTIEVDLKGQNTPQKSFLGIAFDVKDAQTFEAVYFRPFNFEAEDAKGRTRAVQYISWPANTWEKLRATHPGRFESAVKPVPKPDGWFHVRIVVTDKKVSVFVNNAIEPSLEVERLSPRPRGKVGLWVNVYDGEFANLKIVSHYHL